MLKRRLILCGVLGSFLFGFLLCAGCGKKADPIPPKLIRPPTITDFSAASFEEGILLNWSASGPIGLIADFRIFRSEEAADRACPGCPQEYQPLVTLKIADQKILSGLANAFHYMDATVAEGRSYSYRISACDSRGYCGDPSSPIQRLRKKQ